MHWGSLRSGSREAIPRHQTLRATLSWSFELLGEPEQSLFGRLSVFAGGFSLEAVEAVGEGEGIERSDVLESLLMLVDKSLVVAGPTGDRGARYRLLEPVRQYARERLEQSGEADAFRRRHAEFFLGLAEEAAAELTGAHQQEWAKRLEAEHDNMRAALSWSLENEPETTLRLAGSAGALMGNAGSLLGGQRVVRGGTAPKRPRRGSQRRGRAGEDLERGRHVRVASRRLRIRHRVARGGAGALPGAGGRWWCCLRDSVLGDSIPRQG